MPMNVWSKCLERLEAECSADAFHAWIKPLQTIETSNSLTLLAPNRFVIETVQEKYLQKITELVRHYAVATDFAVQLELGALEKAPALTRTVAADHGVALQNRGTSSDAAQKLVQFPSHLDTSYTFIDAGEWIVVDYQEVTNGNPTNSAVVLHYVMGK